MDKPEKDKLEKLLGKKYIERDVKRQTVKGKNGEEIPIVDIQKVTGLDGQDGIVDAELDKITEYDCQCPAEGRANYGGKCAICGATFCNKTANGKPSCYRRCTICHRKICMRHVRGIEGNSVYCSFKCRFLANPLTYIIPFVIAVLGFLLFLKLRSLGHH